MYTSFGRSYYTSFSKSAGASSLPLIKIFMNELQQKNGISMNELQQKLDISINELQQKLNISMNELQQESNTSLKIDQNTQSNSSDKILFYRRKILLYSRKLTLVFSILSKHRKF